MSAVGGEHRGVGDEGRTLEDLVIEVLNNLDDLAIRNVVDKSKVRFRVPKLGCPSLEKVVGRGADAEFEDTRMALEYENLILAKWLEEVRLEGWKGMVAFLIKAFPRLHNDYCASRERKYTNLDSVYVGGRQV